MNFLNEANVKFALKILVILFIFSQVGALRAITGQAKGSVPVSG